MNSLLRARQGQLRDQAREIGTIKVLNRNSKESALLLTILISINPKILCQGSRLRAKIHTSACLNFHLTEIAYFNPLTFLNHKQRWVSMNRETRWMGQPRRWWRIGFRHKLKDMSREPIGLSETADSLRIYTDTKVLNPRKVTHLTKARTRRFRAS